MRCAAIAEWGWEESACVYVGASEGRNGLCVSERGRGIE